ncbi:hypothetical protein MRBLMN1_005758 [Chitinophaga ginsengisegetis]|uniref:hypothetical protein n=1 Tax=Chitinophaga ginsengisegetis TaxID=393003 RepID=UPI00105807B1|nr:hypothetical protein [Chitinophaga ginsengisegetis]MDR6570762.1 hypothetical protein [Chitinophaga ginsengisegetis]MDR6650496.1 hypothetical protein [Chitinophaga ginsengisegetis]MDR6656865.1 hypothetical protein [Chitinophaga ginsengisegetis]
MKFILLALLLATGTTLVAQENAVTKSLSVFKNGQSFVVKEIKAQVADSGFRLNNLPVALFGTYWFAGTTNPVSRVSSRVEQVNEIQERKANSFLELLHANKGKSITIVTTDNNIYKGSVEDFDLPEEINSRLQLQQMQLTNVYRGQYQFDRIYAPANPVLLLKMNGKWIGIEPATIKTITFEDKPSRTTTARIAVQKPIVTVHFAKSGQQSFTMMYLQNGLSWTPVYQLQLVSETEATLNLQAEVNNNVEDIKNTDVDFVMGVPNFSQAITLATLLNFSSTGNVENANIYSNAIQMRADYARDRAAESIVMPEQASSPDNTAVENEDLYFYTLKNISLSKGERAQYPVFNKPVKIHHFYKTVLPASVMSTYQVNGEEGTASEEMEAANHAGRGATPNKVNHFVEIYNNTDNPFTSGAVLILQKNTQKPIAQDVLKFTAKGSSTPIFITTAPDILVREKEALVSVKKEAKTYNGYKYTLATVKGTITVINSKSRLADIQVQKTISGAITSASTKYSQSLNLEYKNDINQGRQLDFELAVDAGAKKSFTYTYEMYIRE